MQAGDIPLQTGSLSNVARMFTTASASHDGLLVAGQDARDMVILESRRSGGDVRELSVLASSNDGMSDVDTLSGDDELSPANVRNTPQAEDPAVLSILDFPQGWLDGIDGRGPIKYDITVQDEPILSPAVRGPLDLYPVRYPQARHSFIPLIYVSAH